MRLTVGSRRGGLNMSKIDLYKMGSKGGEFKVTRKVSFKELGKFKHTTVSAVFRFAYDMTFGGKGEHRHSRSGGTQYRNNLQIFANTFQGKLSEFAVANLFYQHKEFKAPDLSVGPLGYWEDADFKLGDHVIAVKSTKSYGNLLLLETKDWDKNGNYVSGQGNLRSYTHLILVRVKPDIERILSILKKEHQSEYSFKNLECAVIKQRWCYDIPGYVTGNDLKRVIELNHLIPKGAVLNNVVKMDADNYYVQTGDMRKLDTIMN